MNDNNENLKNESLLKSIMDTVSDGVTVIDKDFKVVFQNRSIQSKFGNIKGECCYSAYRGRQEPCSNCAIIEVLKDGKPRKTLQDSVMQNGDIVWMECSCGPLKDKDGNITGAVEIVRNVTENIRLTDENVMLRRQVNKSVGFNSIITQSNEIEKIFELIRKISATKSSVLISGESGTGKELFARAIWSHSDRKDKPFVAINSSSIPENLFESEFFGHAKGSFTGAVEDHIGIVETANGGTLFLDEVGDIPLQMQVKLLRFLQEGTFRRVGETEERKVDVRVISATNINLEESIKESLFREDLFYRLSIIPIFLPPLRNRKEDIPLLATHFLHQYCDSHKRSINGFASDTLKKLLDYKWPGNIRELQNVIEYSMHIADDDQVISINHLPPAVSENEKSSNSGLELNMSIEEYTRQAIVHLQEFHNEEEISSILGISRKNLWEKRKRWNLGKL